MAVGEKGTEEGAHRNQLHRCAAVCAQPWCCLQHRLSPRWRPMGWKAMRPSRSVWPSSERSSLPSADHSLAVESVAPEASVTADSMRPARARQQQGL